MPLPTRRYRPTLAFAVAALLTTLPAAFAADESAQETRRERRHDRLEMMADELGLTDDQKAKFKDLAQQEKAELDLLRDDKSLAPDQRRAKAKEVRQKFQDQRQALMTPEQREKAAKMRERAEKMRERRAERRGGSTDQPAEKPGDK